MLSLDDGTGVEFDSIKLNQARRSFVNRASGPLVDMVEATRCER